MVAGIEADFKENFERVNRGAVNRKSEEFRKSGHEEFSPRDSRGGRKMEFPFRAHSRLSGAKKSLVA
jgi:hypothetical protein